MNTIRRGDAVVGNSSSGLNEVLSFGKPTVNIGSRQQGRLRASSVFDVEGNKESILEAISSALKHGARADVQNP